MLLYRGIYDHRRYFKAKTVAGFAAGQGVWHKPSAADWTGRLFSKSAYGRCAPDGSSLWIDPAKQLFIIFLPSGTTTANAAGISQAQEQINASLIHELGLD